MIVVSHDRYLLERITDQQFAILDGRSRHLPGGVDEYLQLAAHSAGAPEPPRATPKPEAMSGAQRRAAEKELTSVDCQPARLADRIAAKHVEPADHDQSDHAGITGPTAELRALEDEVGALEVAGWSSRKRWSDSHE